MLYVNFSTLECIVFFRKRSDFFLQLYENNGDVMLMTEISLITEKFVTNITMSSCFSLSAPWLLKNEISSYDCKV
jgi:hypothetical protein